MKRSYTLLLLLSTLLAFIATTPLPASSDFETPGGNTAALVSWVYRAEVISNQPMLTTSVHLWDAHTEEILDSRKHLTACNLVGNVDISLGVFALAGGGYVDCVTPSIPQLVCSFWGLHLITPEGHSPDNNNPCSGNSQAQFVEVEGFYVESSGTLASPATSHPVLHTESDDIAFSYQTNPLTGLLSTHLRVADTVTSSSGAVDPGGRFLARVEHVCEEVHTPCRFLHTLISDLGKTDETDPTDLETVPVYWQSQRVWIGMTEGGGQVQFYAGTLSYVEWDPFASGSTSHG